MTAARSLPRYGARSRAAPLPPGYTPGVRPTGAVRTALPVIYQLRQDGVSWPARALAAQGVGVPAIPRRLEWSTAMVHSAPTRPPWLHRKRCRATVFDRRRESGLES
jgi:hypothetical protein